MAQRIEKELHDQIMRLNDDQQLRLLEFARSLAQSAEKGEPGQTLMRFAGTIEKADLASIGRAIEDGCETVDHNEW